MSWIKLHRKILKNEISKNPKYLSVWIHLLLRASWSGFKDLKGNDVLAGSLKTGRKLLSAQIGISEGTLERALKMLETSNMIKQETFTTHRIISVLNFEKYQALEQQTNNYFENKKPINTDNKLATNETTDRTTDRTTDSTLIKKEEERYKEEIRKLRKIIYDMKNPKRFIKPTIEQIKEYCKERNNTIDADKFFNYYESNGWRVGRNPMKDWRASVRTWEKTDYGKDKQTSRPLSAKAERNKYAGLEVTCGE